MALTTVLRSNVLHCDTDTPRIPAATRQAKDKDTSSVQNKSGIRYLSVYHDSVFIVNTGKIQHISYENAVGLSVHTLFGLVNCTNITVC